MSTAPSPIPGFEKFFDSFVTYPSGNLSYLYSLDGTDVGFIAAYFGILLLLAVYGFYRLRIVYQFWRYAQHAPVPAGRTGTRTGAVHG